MNLCESVKSVGVFFMPWASSFSLYLSAVMLCEVLLLIPLSVHQRRL